MQRLPHLRKNNWSKPLGPQAWQRGLPHDKKNIIPKGKERTERWTSSKGKKGPSKHTCTPMSTEAPFPIAKTREQAKCPSAEAWIKRMRFICTGGYPLYAQCKLVKDQPTEISQMIIEYIDHHKYVVVDKRKWLHIVY